MSHRSVASCVVSVNVHCPVLVLKVEGVIAVESSVCVPVRVGIEGVSELEKPIPLWDVVCESSEN